MDYKCDHFVYLFLVDFRGGGNVGGVMSGL